MINCSRMRSANHRWKALRGAGLLVLTAAIAACDELPTMPGNDDPAPQMALVAPDIDGAVQDALSRLIPSLVDASAAEPLRLTLTNLQKLLADHNGDGAAEATKAALGMIDVYERRTGYNGAEAADLDAIRLALR